MTSRTISTTARPAAGLAAAALLAAGLLLGLVPGLGGSPAGAHDGPAIVVIEQVHPAGLQQHYIVRVTWEDDGHPAEDATVTATAIAADGTQLTPVPLAPADDDGRYAGAIEPTGSVEQPQEITAPATTDAPDGAGEVATAPGDGEGDEGFAPADDGTGDSDEAATDASDGSDDSGMPVYLLVAAAAVAVIGAVTAVTTIRRHRASGPAEASAGGAPPAGDGSHAPDGGGDGAGDGTPAGGVSSTTRSS